MKEKKMRTMVNQNLEMKEYVKKGTLYSARKTWEVRSHMLDVAGNYPGNNKYNKASRWMCQACDLEVKEDQEHLTRCRGYEDLRGDADLNMENELVGDGEEKIEQMGLGGRRRCTAARLGQLMQPDS